MGTISMECMPAGYSKSNYKGLRQDSLETFNKSFVKTVSGMNVSAKKTE